MTMHALAAAQVADVGTTLASVQVLSLFVGTVLPILVGLVTTKATHPGTKAVLLALLSAVSGLLTEYLAAGDGFNWTTAGLTWLSTFMIAVATHFGLWKPTGITAAVQSIGVTGRKA